MATQMARKTSTEMATLDKGFLGTISKLSVGSFGVFVGAMTGFHCLSHLSFAMYNHFPSYAKDSIYYDILMNSDILTHLSLSIYFYFDIFHKQKSKINEEDEETRAINEKKAKYRRYKAYLFLFWFIWHKVKVWDTTWTLRKLHFMNVLEAVSYVYGFYEMFGMSVLGVGLYAIFRYKDWVW